MAENVVGEASTKVVDEDVDPAVKKSQRDRASREGKKMKKVGEASTKVVDEDVDPAVKKSQRDRASREGKKMKKDVEEDPAKLKEMREKALRNDGGEEKKQTRAENKVTEKEEKKKDDVDNYGRKIFFAHQDSGWWFKCIRCCCCKCCKEAKVTDACVHTEFIDFPYMIHEQLDFNYVFDIQLDQPWYSCCCCGLGTIKIFTGSGRDKQNHTYVVDNVPRARNVFDDLSKHMTEGNFRRFRVANNMGVGAVA